MSETSVEVKHARREMAELPAERPPAAAIAPSGSPGSPNRLEAEVNYWRSKYYEEREKLGKLWLLLQDAEAEVRQLESRSIYKAPEPVIPAPKPKLAPKRRREKSQVLTPTVVYEPKQEPPKAIPKPEDKVPFEFKDYRLYSREVNLKSGSTTRVYFFSRKTPIAGTLSAKPAGYVVGVSERTGLPFLKRARPGDYEGEVLSSGVKKHLRPQCMALTGDGSQCRNSARQSSKYCASHKGYQPPSAAALVKSIDTAPRGGKPAADVLPSVRKARATKLETAVVTETEAARAKTGQPQQCGAVGSNGLQCKNLAREGSRYCPSHKGFHPKGVREILRSRDRTPRVAGAPDTVPAMRRSL